jgi:AraC-like DNA-binding protein
MTTDRVRMWRPVGHERVLLMKGETTRYAIEPRGEYVFGVIDRQPMRSRRGRERRLVAPGQLVAWDPSGAHSGTGVDGRPWSARLMVVEIADLDALAHDPDRDVLANVAFPEPVLSDPALVASFRSLHAAFERPTTRLEQDERLTGWLLTLLERAASNRRRRPALSARDDRALRRAFDYLGDHPLQNVGLDELAGAAGIGKYRLVRLVRERTGLPPHALQIAHRIRAARRLLEAGEPVAATAAATGFADQSHLHRHFQRALGLTPRQYQDRFDATRRRRDTLLT